MISNNNWIQIGVGDSTEKCQKKNGFLPSFFNNNSTQ